MVKSLTNNRLLRQSVVFGFRRGNYPHPTYCIFDTENHEVQFYDLKENQPCNPFEVKKKESFFKRFFK